MQDGKHVILAIDDDADFRQVIKFVLESKGYVVLEAQTAEDGLKVCRQSSPDLVLVDLMMESIDAGANFVKELKLIGKDDVPIFLLSGAGDGMNRSTDYTALGFSGVFQKPIENERLLKVIEEKLK